MVRDLPKKLHFDALSNLVWKISLQEGKDVTNVKARASFYDQPAAAVELLPPPPRALPRGALRRRHNATIEEDCHDMPKAALDFVNANYMTM